MRWGRLGGGGGTRPLLDRPDVGKRRITIIAAVVLAAFCVVAGQLWYLQVLEGGHFLDASDKNRIRIRPVAAPRGILFDRHGAPLVDNRPAFTLSLMPRELPRESDERDAVLGRVAALLRIPFAELTEAVSRVSADSFLPVRVRRGLSIEDMAKVEEWKLELPGVIVEVEPQRTYPSSRFAAHLLGYVREANEEHLRQGRHRRGDMVGQSGLERLLDEYLRGRDGGERIEVDVLGRPVRIIQQTEPRPGAEVVTTVDRRIQEAAEASMEGRAGAVVVMDPRNGDVLAMVSTPAFAIDRFTGTIDRAAWVRLVQDPDHPLLNRTLQSQYAPGSIFKIIVTAAGLQERTLTPFDRTYCSGQFQLGTGTFKDWKEEGHGLVDLKEAMVQSCNVFFYEAGLKVGGGMMTRYARAFGFGEATGIDLGSERVGLIPRPRLRRGRQIWAPGDVVNMSIGQGQLLVTPLQVAAFMSAVANGGVRWKPRLIQRVERPGAGLLWSDSGKVAGHVELSPLVWAFLRKSLTTAVRDGTGASVAIPGLEIAGKTGTAQTTTRSRTDQDHAWFAGFAPAHDPEVVVVVLVERGGPGGQVAAPVARKIFNAIFFEKVAWLGMSG